MLTELDNLMDNDHVLALCRIHINDNIRTNDWSELYITSIVRRRDTYIIKYGVVLNNEEEFHNTCRITGV